MRTVVIYRGTLLYGESGTGKSSLVNAGLIPAAERKGFRADRVRVQPRLDEELVVERVAATSDGDSFLPSSFAAGEAGTPRLVLSTDAFRAQLEALPEGARPLLIFDQFEELSSLFEETAQADGRAEALAARQRIVDLLVDLLRDEEMQLKVLLAFREDYLAKVTELLAARPELVDHAIRLTPPATDALDEIIRGPFERYPGEFGSELSPELAGRLRDAIESRSASGHLSLSEVQIVCLRLWQSPDPERVFDEKGIQGLLEEYLSESLEQFPDDLRDPAVAVLSKMVTPSGARNLVSAENVIADVQAEEELPADRVERALVALEQQTKLVRRERRGKLYLYELASEFLLPWIRQRREERLAARAAAREAERQRKVRRKAIIFTTVFAAASVAFAALAAFAFYQWDEARTQKRTAQDRAVLARSRAFAFGALQEATDPGLPLLLSLEAYRLRPASFQARNSLALSLETAAQRPLAAVFRVHRGVYGVALSPDRRTLVSADEDGTLQFWDAVRRRAIGEPRRSHHGIVYAVAFDPKGRTIASAGVQGPRGVVRLWDVRRRRRIGGPLHGRFGSIDSGHGSVRSVAFSPNGSLLASAGFDELVWLWSGKSGRQAGKPLQGYENELRSVAFSPEGNVLGAAGKSGVMFWNIKTRKRVGDRLQRNTEVNAVAFSPDGELFATGDDDGTVRVWRRGRRPRLIRKLGGNSASVRSLAFDPGTITLAWAGDDGTVRLWKVGSRSAPTTLPVSPARAVESLVFSSDGTALLTAGLGGSIGVWRTDNSPGLGRTLASGGSPLSLACVGRLNFGGGDCTNLAFDPDGRLVSTQADGSVVSWDRSSARRMLVPHRRPPRAVAFNRRGGVVAEASRTGVIRLWRLATGRLIGRVLQTHRRIFSLAVSPNARRVAVGTVKGAIETWNARSGTRSARLRGDRCSTVEPTRCYPVYALAFSHTGRLLASGGYDGLINLWDARSGRQKGMTLKGTEGSVDTVEFSPDDRILASGGSDKKLRFWKVASQRPTGEALEAHGNRVTTVAYDSSGRFLVSGGYDGRVRIWDVAAGEELGRALAAGSRDAAAVAFSPGGRTIAFAGVDGVVRIWKGILSPGLHFATRAVCSRVAGNLSATEWQTFSPGAPYHATCRN
jgi:WD40 repeat protein